MTDEKIYKAHVKTDEQGNTIDIQTVKQHNEDTAKLAEEFAVPKLKGIVGAMGLLHDVGKYQPSFQRKIDGAALQVDHSTCGALAAKQEYGKSLGLMMGYCIAGHHSGIPDGEAAPNDTPDMPTLRGRLQKELEDFSKYKSEIRLPQLDEREFQVYLSSDCTTKEQVIEKFAFFTRYCFSCLTDADSLDTAEFTSGKTERSLSADFEACLERVNSRLAAFTPKTDLQKTRAVLQNQVFEKSELDSEIYLMNMPTGSGKTLCSIKFALERAIKTGKKRIIYIIPYNSIIDQTAEEFSSMFSGCADILRHQSTFSYDELDDTKDSSKGYGEIAKLAAENWDAQLIITTAVQFFESIYANKRGKLRKLHNMADSVLVFDEAHLMPRNYLQPCLRAISYITKYLNSEAVFLTATMPDFKSLISQYAMQNSKIADLVSNTSEFYKFNKCSYVNIGEISEESLITKASLSPSSLIVVNSRAQARKLYQACPGKRYHLSTYMTAFDRKRIIDEIKLELQKLEKDYPNLENVPDDRRITVVSTSLIEAGVDLDFYCVFRELSGLDSILQSGGRCNREGKRKNAEVFIFTLEGVKIPSQDERANITKGLINRYQDISCPESIAEYYDKLFFVERDKLTANSISNESKQLNAINFRTYAEKFEIIENNTISVAVPRDENSAKLIDALRFGAKVSPRKLQKYCFSVKRYEFEKLATQGVINDFDSGIFCLTNHEYYDENLGVKFEGKDIYIN